MTPQESEKRTLLELLILESMREFPYVFKLTKVSSLR